VNAEEDAIVAGPTGPEQTQPGDAESPARSAGQIPLPRMCCSLLCCSTSELFDSLFQNSLEGIAVTDEKGLVIDINARFCQKLGRPRSLLVGRPLHAWFEPPDDVAVEFAIGQAAQEGRAFRLEEWRLIRPCGQRLWLEGACVRVGEADRPRSVLCLVRNVTDRKSWEAQLLDNSERERSRIGRELHDDFGQCLTGVALMTQYLSDQLAAAGHDRDAACAARSQLVLTEAIQRMRNWSRGLTAIDVGGDALPETLADLAAFTSEVSGVACSFAGSGGPVAIDGAASRHLYRIAQEAMSNAVKHAQAKKILVRLDTAAHVTLSIEDDGRGFDVSTVPHQGLGLRIMRYRTQVIRGELHLASSERGTTVRVRVRQSPTEVQG